MKITMSVICEAVWELAVMAFALYIFFTSAILLPKILSSILVILSAINLALIKIKQLVSKNEAKS